ncbi:DUF4377 domain-containing protein [Algoriphagus sp. SE2]|uniref:DUF4377 domain-containing protein n=1 Tax=Algoriphagus sp. SE2 TaxID=3141536 RepID=UPI0031CD43DC
MKIYLSLIVIILSVMSCEKEGTDIETWWINSSKKDCVGVGPMSCLQIQKAKTLEEGNWQFFYDQIQGFDYEPGYIYQIKVKVSDRSTPVPADASSKVYQLVEIMSKEMDENLRITNTWKLLKVGEIENPINKKSNETLIFEFNASEMSFFGDMGCNTVRGKIQSIDSTNIEFGPGASTKMACIDMSVENEILKAITATKTYQIGENQLTLLDDNGAVLMVFQAVD